MAQLKEIRNRIVSVKNTRQVTSAMKMVSASKLKKAQDMILQIKPYERKLHEIIENLSLGVVEFSSAFFSEPALGSVLVVVIGGNRGLCGGFNTNVVKYSILHSFDHFEYQLKSGKVEFFSVGKQVEKGLKSKGIESFGEANDLMLNLNVDEINDLADRLIDLFQQGKFQRIDIVYNRFKNAAVQVLTAEQFLPVIKPPTVDKESIVLSDFIYEPSKEEILESIVPQALKMQLHRILLDSNAAEQGARMTAMHQATENANDLIKELTTTYNNTRQSAITNEIVEITAGAEALN
jgi:F-type H+-transporting ATPase subunit gamma